MRDCEGRDRTFRVYPLGAPRRAVVARRARRHKREIRRGGMALRATALRRLAPALASAGVALAWREQSRTAAEPAQQRLFSCGVLRPSDTGDRVPARSPPSEAAFWASKGLRVVNMSYGQHHAAAVDHGVTRPGLVHVRALAGRRADGKHREAVLAKHARVAHGAVRDEPSNLIVSFGERTRGAIE